MGEVINYFNMIVDVLISRQVNENRKLVNIKFKAVENNATYRNNSRGTHGYRITICNVWDLLRILTSLVQEIG